MAFASLEQLRSCACVMDRGAAGAIKLRSGEASFFWMFAIFSQVTFSGGFGN